jgi:hypothetical protein
MKSMGYRFGYLYTPFSTLTLSFHRLHFYLQTRGGGGKIFASKNRYKSTSVVNSFFQIYTLKMSNVEFFSRLNREKLTSLDEDFTAWRKEFQEDERRNALKRAGRLKVESVETTYERFPEET